MLKKEDGRDRLAAAGAEHPQSRARIAAVAGRADRLSRAAVARLEDAERDRGSGADRGRPPGRCVSLKPLGGGLRRRAIWSLLEVQLEGRKRMSAADFANGQRLTENDILGEPRI